MKPRKVLLDGSFLAAVLDDDHPAHERAIDTYAELIDAYESGSDRLFALSTVLADLPAGARGGAFAPVETAWVARQHRLAAAEINPARVDPHRPEIALTLVMLQRERFSAIATALSDYDPFDIAVLSIAPRPDTESGDEPPEGYVRFRTAQPPARQSTDQ